MLLTLSNRYKMPCFRFPTCAAVQYINLPRFTFALASHPAAFIPRRVPYRETEREMAGTAAGSKAGWSNISKLISAGYDKEGRKALLAL